MVRKNWQDEFAQILGFANFESLLWASKLVVGERDVNWYVVELSDGRWATWNDTLDLNRVRYFSNREAAIQCQLAVVRSIYG